MIHNRDELKECRQKAKADMETADCRILVCSGTGCIATGSEKIYNRFLKLANITPGVSVIFAPHDEGTHIGLKKTGCQGFCELGPLVRITKNDETVQYVKVQLDDCQELFERAVLGDEVVERLLYRKEKKVPKLNHQVCSAIQLSQPLSSPSPPTFSLAQHQDLVK